MFFWSLKILLLTFKAQDMEGSSGIWKPIKGRTQSIRLGLAKGIDGI